MGSVSTTAAIAPGAPATRLAVLRSGHGGERIGALFAARGRTNAPAHALPVRRGRS
jgi:hypothetical protein